MDSNEKCIVFGTVTILVDVGSTVPLVITGIIQNVSPLFGKHRDKTVLVMPKKNEKHQQEVEVEGAVVELEQFLIVEVTAAVLPPGFPLTITQLTTGDVAINLDYVIMILPVEEI